MTRWGIMSSMTTSMNDIVDFVRILNEQPEWADTIRGILLGQELLALPRQLAQFVQATNERLGRLETDVTDLKAGQARLENSVGQLDTRVGRLEGKVGRLEGSDLEREVHGNIVNIASRGLGLNRARILQSKIIPRGTELQDAIDDAEEQGIITEDQGSHLELTDVIIAARRKSDRQECYVVAEVSAGVRNDDITRARDRAQTLATIKGAPVIPAVIGASIAPQQQALADRDGVSVILTLRLAPPADEHIGNQAN